MIDFISQPWHWAVSGVMASVVMMLLIYLGKRFGISSSFESLCSIGGGSRLTDYFKRDLKSDQWLLVFIIGSMVGGYIASHFLASPAPVAVSDATISDLASLGILTPTSIDQGYGFMPDELFSIEALTSLRGIVFMVLGGFLIGFGTRWAGGCTSGHAISGMSNLQLPSLVAVIGFFIGGLVMTHLLFPFIINL